MFREVRQFQDPSLSCFTRLLSQPFMAGHDTMERRVKVV